MKRHQNQINKRKNLKFKKCNSVNLLRKSDFNLFPVPNSKNELIVNIKKTLIVLNNTNNLDAKSINLIKLFDYLVLYGHFIFNEDTDSSRRFKNTVLNKLVEFSKDTTFGPRRSKYYIRIIFPDNKCIHKSTQNGELCVYKKYKNFEYCRTHSDFIQNYVKIIENNTEFYKTIISLIVQYM
jgi:hypothetical protein